MFARTTEAPVLLIGAAHVVDLGGPLRTTLGGRVLDGVAVELDAERAEALMGGGARSGGRADVPIFARLWAVVQKRLGAEIGGGSPGDEMKVAVTVARERNLPVFLIDDPIRATLLELVRTMPFKERVALFVGAFVGLFVPAKVVEHEMDRYTENPDEFAQEIRRASPTIARVLLDDRNEHMADRLASLRGQGYGRLAVVVGDAHLPGLSAALGRRSIPVEAIPFRQLREVRAPSSSPS